MANILYYLIREWHPRYPTTQALLQACVQDDDPLLIRCVPLLCPTLPPLTFEHSQTKYLDKFQKTVAELPRLREERLPPPRVSQSEVYLSNPPTPSHSPLTFPQYDKIGLTCD